MICPKCGAHLRDGASACPKCGYQFQKKKSIGLLTLAIINGLLFTYLVPLLISFILNQFNLSFVYLTLIGWIPCGLFAMYILYRYYLSTKQNDYPIFKGVIATILSMVMVCFCALMVITSALKLFHIYSAYNDVKVKYEVVQFIAHEEKKLFYFEDQDGFYYCYNMEDYTFDQDEKYAGQMDMMYKSILVDDDGTYFLIQ